MRTKRKTYDYQSSDYGNEDYGQDDFEGEDDDFDEEDQVEESEGDSEYGESADEKGKNKESAKGRTSNKRANRDQEEEIEDTYEDEDPFSPEIDLILADKQIEVPIQQIPLQCNPSAFDFNIRRNSRIGKVKSQYTVTNQDTKLVSYQICGLILPPCKMDGGIGVRGLQLSSKIKDSKVLESKRKKALYSKLFYALNILQQEQLQRQAIGFKQEKNHHFSEDEEEEEEDEAGIKGIPLPDLPLVIEDSNEVQQVKASHIKVEGLDGEDLTQYFDKNYSAVERILSTTIIFPVIHPRQAKLIRGKWQEDCLKVMNVLINFRKNNVCIGLAFAEQLDAEKQVQTDQQLFSEDLAEYFKVVKQPIDFIMIMNRLYNKLYQQPQEFWNDLGQVFKNCRLYYKSTKIGLRKQCDALRLLAFNLYNDWYNEQKTQFTTGIALPIPPPPQQFTEISQNKTTEGNKTIQPPINQQPEKDLTIVNLTSLLQGQKNAQEQQKQVQQQQQIPSQPLQQQQQQQQVQQALNINQNRMANQSQELVNPQQQFNELWNMQRPSQLQPPQPMNNLQQMQNPQQMGLQQQTPNLPKLNQIMNPMNATGAQAFQDPMMMPQQQQQQMNQNFLNQNQFRQMSNQISGNLLYGQGQQQQQFLPPQQQQNSQQYDQQSTSPQVDWMQGNIDKSIIKSFLGGAGTQGVFQQNEQQLHLPGLGQLPQNLLQNNFLMQQANQMGNPFYPPGQNQLMGMDQYQALQQEQNKNLSLLNQMMGGYQNPNALQMDPMNAMSIMGQGGQDFNQLMRQQQPQHHTQLPSLAQLQGFGQQQMGGIQLPSLSSLGQSIGSQFSTFDPYSSMINQGFMQNQQQQMFPRLMSGFNSASAYDEMSMMLSGANNNMTGALGNFGQIDMQNQLNAMGMGGFNNQQMLLHQNLFGNLPQMNQNQMQMMKPQQQQQKTTIIDPNLLNQQDNDKDNDKQDPPVAPCIMDPGIYELSWLLEPGEKIEDITKITYLTQEEIEGVIKQKHWVDKLYLVKWKGLSYTQSSWEPESQIKELFDDKIQDYNKFNRALDQFQRERLDYLIKNHKKMLRVTEKKYQSGKRIDAVQENLFSLQEAKINRALLNQKIQEVMGDAFYQVVQYSQQNGIVPQFKKPHQKLKDYQVQGLNWLIRAWHEHRNVVLADEMGLGKTIMTLSLFDHLNKVYKLRGPYLILAPLTTLEHWKRIADEWTNLNAVLYYDPGSAEGRQEIRQWEWYFTDVTYKGTITQKSELYKFNIMITSFEVFMQDLNPILQEIPFIYIVVDEAHRLKNKQAKTLKLLKDHPCKRILLLTGTPVQNNTKELWTLLNYIEPEKFNSLDQFLEQYGNLETYEQIQKLHTILKPHFLRRLKEEVDNSIPPLNETVIEVGLTTLQNTYYKGIYGENRMVLAKFGTNSIKTSQLNNIDVQLRKCCNHLFLLKGVEEELTRDCKNEQDLYKKLLDSSGKLMLLDKFIEKFKQENHKMLIFSQFKRMLDIIELYLKMKSVPFEKLTGSVKTQDRISAIQRFNDDKTFGVFLLTTRAGGLGINLTSARVVIIFDSDWNPQNDLQAIARAHRIGQKFEVQVYRLITSKTYEEQMFERASKKLGMEQALFSKGAFHQNEVDLGTLHLKGLSELKQDSKEIENLLKYGAYAFIDNDGEENDQVNKDIDEILATGKKKEFTYNKGLYTLQKSTFNASKYEKLPDVEDPDFWNKVMPYDSIISISVLDKKFKKEKKEMGKNEKLQKEFIKDLEIVFNDFMDAKFDVKTTNASRKQLESDEERLREILKKMIKLSGMKLLYVEKCKEWLREMLRTNKRKKPNFKTQPSESIEDGAPIVEDDFDNEPQIEEDDIIMYDSDEQAYPQSRSLRKRNVPTTGQKENAKEIKSQTVGGKRGRKPKKQPGKASYEESENNYGDEDIYGDEEDKDLYQQVSDDMGQDDGDYNEGGGSDDEEENRYGLRGRRKRQKTGREEMLIQQQQKSGQNIPRMNDQFAKRNEKNGIVCGYCLHPETQDNLCIWFCQGYCQRFFHEECKDTLFANSGKKLPNSSLNKGIWQCDDCLDNKAHCFCCKQKGQILVFPKKGKPKAAGQSGDINLLGANEVLNYEEYDNLDDDLDDDMYSINGDDDLDDPLINGTQNGENSPIKTENNKENESQKQSSQESQNKKEEDIVINIDQENSEQNSKSNQKESNGEESGKIVIGKALSVEEKKDVENLKEGPLLPQLNPSVSTKIVISTSLKPPVQEPIQEKLLSPINEPEVNDSKYVVRCTLGGCFKYYHVNCVYKNKNVSCINSMKVQRFRCPLHYCEICQASGDSVLIVQCVTCPTAYHLKCLPQDTKAIRLTKKYIICGKHNMSQEDFPKYEEKANTSLYGSKGTPVISQQKLDKQLQQKKNKKQKKRGRKPKQAQQYDDYGDEASDMDQPPMIQQQNLSSKALKSNSSFVIQLSEGSHSKAYNTPQIARESTKSDQQLQQSGPKILFQVEKHQQKRESKESKQQLPQSEY